MDETQNPSTSEALTSNVRTWPVRPVFPNRISSAASGLVSPLKRPVEEIWIPKCPRVPDRPVAATEARPLWPPFSVIRRIHSSRTSSGSVFPLYSARSLSVRGSRPKPACAAGIDNDQLGASGMARRAGFSPIAPKPRTAAT
jgi:hypothetical protein